MGRMDREMLTVAICQEFGWTYTEYQEQPQWFIALIIEKLKRDRKEQERAVTKTKRG